MLRLLRSFATAAAAATVISAGGAFVACSGDEIVAAPVAPPAVTPEVDAAPPPDPPDAGPPKRVLTPTFPEVQSRGGPVITSPKVVPILFAGDPLEGQIGEFTTKIAASQYWKNVGAEYGVGPITPVTPIVVSTETAPATITSSQIEAWLAQKLTGAAPEFGAPDASTLYALFYPPGTTITMEDAGELGQSCQGYGAYHYEINAGGTQVGYAVHPRCSDIDELTVAASHEYFEWATDPFPKTKPAYSKLDDPHWAWQAAMIGELSDLCTYLDQEFLRPAEIGFVVQRHWSNKLSLAGKYPCAPPKTAPYLQGITFAEDDAFVPDYGTFSQPIKTKAVRVPPGGTKTVDVLVYSDQASSAPIPLLPQAYEEFYGGKNTTGFSYSLDRSYAKPGESVRLTVTAPTKAPAYDLMMMLAYTSDRTAHYWPVLVVNDDGADIAQPSITPEMLPKKPKKAGAHATGARRPFTTLGTRRVR